MARNRTDLFGGLLLVAIAAIGLLFLAPLPFGTAARPDAAFLPTIVCAVLGALGVLVTLRGVLGLPDSIERIHLRPAAGILGAIAVFALLLERAGLPAAVVGAVMTAAVARPGLLDWRSAVFALLLAAGCTAAFRYGLNIPFRLLP
jgi:hypothetical protein